MTIKKILFYSIIPVVLLFLFYPILFGGKVFFEGDTNFWYYPAHLLLSNSINHGTSFYWDNTILNGFPLYTSIVGGFYYPLNFIFHKFFDFITAYNWISFFNFLLAAFCAYFFIRSLKLSKYASLIAALTFIFSQWCILYIALDSITNFYFVLPLLFLSLLKVSQGNYWYILVGGLTLGLGWLGGHPQFVLYIAFSAFLFSLFLDFINYNKNFAFYKNFKVLKSLILIFLKSLIIGFPQIIAYSKLSGLNNRAEGLNYQEAIVDHLSILDLTRYFFPDFNFPVLSNSPSIYIGFLSFFLALVAIFYLKGEKIKNFFIGLFLFCLLISFKYSPVFWFLRLMPVFKYFRGPARWLFIGSFALAILAAYGFDYVFKEFRKLDKLSKFLKILLILLIITIVFSNLIMSIFGNKIIILLQNYFDKNLYAKTTKLPIEHYHKIISDYTYQVFNNFNLLNYKFLIPFLFIILTYLLIKFYQKQKFNLNIFRNLALGIVISNFLFIYIGYYPLTIPKKQYLRISKTAEFIKNREENLSSFRIFSLMPGMSEYYKIRVPYNASYQESFDFQAETITPNLNTIYGLQSIDGYQDFMTRRQSKILAEIGSERAVIGNKLSEKEISLDDKLSEFLSKLDILSMMNVKYIISAFPLKTEKLKLVFETKATKYDIPVYVYENLKVMPRVYLVNKVKFISGSEDENLEAVLDKNIDFFDLTLIECKDCQAYTNNKKGLGTLNIEEYKNGLIKIFVNNEAGPNWLIFSESNLPGWQAKIDGVKTDIYTTNYIFQAIKIPAGKHLVEFKYH